MRIFLDKHHWSIGHEFDLLRRLLSFSLIHVAHVCLTAFSQNTSIKVWQIWIIIFVILELNVDTDGILRAFRQKLLILNHCLQPFISVIGAFTILIIILTVEGGIRLWQDWLVQGYIIKIGILIWV